jgi:DNA-binding LacI/PurR family transcriptional regulator
MVANTGRTAEHEHLVVNDSSGCKWTASCSLASLGHRRIGYISGPTAAP